MTPLTQKFLEHSAALFAKGDKLLLAVSGGLDSVVLVHLCKDAGFDFAMAHAHFGLRGSESERDAAFVRALAEESGVTLHCRQFDTKVIAAARHLSIQETARMLRYEWFEELLQSERRQWLLTAHHRDDNIETMLMNFFKGTGISGMRGMAARNGRVLRPIIHISRAELYAHATSQNLQWVEDSSNASSDYTRNFVRNELFPLLQERFPGVADNLAANLERFRDTEILFKQAVVQYRKTLLIVAGNEYRIPVLKLIKTPAYETVLFELAKEFGFRSGQLPELLKLLYAQSGATVWSSTHRAIRHRAWLILAPYENTGSQVISIGEGERQVNFPAGSITIEQTGVDATQFGKEHIAWLDARYVSFPLILRRPMAGDYFYPLGMRKKKKLARFFIDQKMPVTEKEKVWVLEAAGRIIWVVGLRIDDRARVQEGTKKVWKLTFSSPG